MFEIDHSGFKRLIIEVVVLLRYYQSFACSCLYRQSAGRPQLWACQHSIISTTWWLSIFFQPDQWPVISLQHSAAFVSQFSPHISSFSSFQMIDINILTHQFDYFIM